MVITSDDAISLLNGWGEDGNLLKVSLFTAGNRDVAVVFGTLAVSLRRDLVVGTADPKGGIDLQRSHMIFRLDDVARFELETADWAALNTGAALGDYLLHGDTMLIVLYEDGAHLTVGRILAEDA